MQFKPTPMNLTHKEKEVFSFMKHAWDVFVSMEDVDPKDFDRFAFHINAAVEVIRESATARDLRDLRDLNLSEYYAPQKTNDTTD